MTGGVAQVVESLPSNCEDLSSNPSTAERESTKRAEVQIGERNMLRKSQHMMY
jgi:hypothetical protein